MTTRPATRHRSIEVLRGAWGAALVAAPHRVLGPIPGIQVDSRSRFIARILGARHLTQATLSGYRSSPEVLAMGVWWTPPSQRPRGLAVVDSGRARAGVSDAVIAACGPGPGTATSKVPARPHRHIKGSAIGSRSASWAMPRRGISCCAGSVEYASVPSIRRPPVRSRQNPMRYVPFGT
ncbi:hypothetical protein MB901379_01453 [Mycobacterium basiliense]|uniref:Uncharacterized protein n=1 Tax=Mycobacterium basiliense TaxID=2094119 RepID=A0A3S4BD38_9MYCO|nr:hypothetical protein MB901379_01453 [Mycobacterium basiliense]